MATDWIHCNKCFAKYDKANNLKFYLTSCGHLNCHNCVARMKQQNSVCLICSNNTEVVQLTNDISEDIQSLFLPLTKTIDKLKQIHMFQESNLLSLLKHIYVKYSYAKNTIHKLCTENNELKKNNRRLMAAIKSNMSTCSSTAKSTPIPGSTSPSFNLSLISPIGQINMSDMRRQTMMKPIPGPAYRQMAQFKNGNSSLSINSNNVNDMVQSSKMQPVPVHNTKMTSIHFDSPSNLYHKTGVVHHRRI